jgi:predicted nucleic acid-binding protein
VIVFSDTNILSSLAAGAIFPSLPQLFAQSDLKIPPAVFQELQTGIARGKAYLELVRQAVELRQIAVIALSPHEEQLMQSYPPRLNLGERQAIALTQTRNALLLSNDKRAIRYCQTQQIRVLNLENILRQLWVRQVLTRHEVDQAIERMALVEHLTISAERRAAIFAPHRPGRRL